MLYLKKVFLIIMSVVLFIGCTNRTVLRYNYKDTETTKSPIKAYTIKQDVEYVSKGKMNYFPWYNSFAPNDIVGGGMYGAFFFITVPIDIVLSLTVVPLHNIASYEAQEHYPSTKIEVFGKLVDYDNNPIQNQEFDIFLGDRFIQSISTDENGIFNKILEVKDRERYSNSSYENSNSSYKIGNIEYVKTLNTGHIEYTINTRHIEYTTEPQKITFVFDAKDVVKIEYNPPFKEGTRFINKDGKGVIESKLKAQGNIIVIEPDFSLHNTKIKNNTKKENSIIYY